MVLPKQLAGVLGGAWQLLNSTPTYLNGTLRTPSDVDVNPVGILIYHPAGYMSANIASTDPSHVPPIRENTTLTDSDFILLGRHQLSYAGELHVWEGSNETAGTVTHGPLTMSNRPSFLRKIQTRNYNRHRKNFEGRDVLHLWLRDEEHDVIPNLFWAKHVPDC